MVPDGRVTVTVTNGWLALNGTLDWQYQKDAAVRAVRDLKGKTVAVNELGGVEHVLLFIVAGNAPEAAYTPEATKRINEYHDGVGAVVSHGGVQRRLLRPVGD